MVEDAVELVPLGRDRDGFALVLAALDLVRAGLADRAYDDDRVSVDVVPVGLGALVCEMDLDLARSSTGHLFQHSSRATLRDEVLLTQNRS